MTFRKYLVLAGVTVFAAAGDSMLSHGMKQIGSISPYHLQGLILAVLNPWVAVGILLLLAFFASYMNALSWADLTYVLPATSLGYVLLALVAKFALHEQISLLRWLGIVLISGGVGFVAGGEALTSHEPGEASKSSLGRTEGYKDGALAEEKSKSPLLPKAGRNGAPDGKDRDEAKSPHRRTGEAPAIGSER
ncbi:MAG: EamA family transporter [Candidatus Sulfotelmatobacter sp.]